MNHVGILGKTTTRKCEVWVVKDTKIRYLNQFIEKRGLTHYIKLLSKGRRIHRPEYLVEIKNFWKSKGNNFSSWFYNSCHQMCPILPYGICCENMIPSSFHWTCPNILCLFRIHSLIKPVIKRKSYKRGHALTKQLQDNI